MIPSWGEPRGITPTAVWSISLITSQSSDTTARLAEQRRSFCNFLPGVRSGVQVRSSAPTHETLHNRSGPDFPVVNGWASLSSVKREVSIIRLKGKDPRSIEPPWIDAGIDDRHNWARRFQGAEAHGPEPGEDR